MIKTVFFQITASPFSDDGEMKLYFRPSCIFETFKRARATTKIIEEPGDIDGFKDVSYRKIKLNENWSLAHCLYSFAAQA